MEGDDGYEDEVDQFTSEIKISLDSSSYVFHQINYFSID